MVKWNISLSNLTTTKIIPAAKKVAITALAVAALSFGAQTNAIASDSEMTTVYYVYSNDKYIGTVSDKKIVDSVVKTKLQEVKASYEGINLSTDSQVTYIPEQTFRSSVKTNNEKVVKQLKEELEIQATVSSITIDGVQVAFLENEEMAQEVINKLKLQYVSQEQLNEVELRKKEAAQTLAPLQENETRILDVRLSKDVSITKEQVTPNQIMSVDNAITLLKNGTLEQKKYLVQTGDVLGSIANNNGLTLSQMIEINPELNENSVLQIGQEVNITVLVPYVQVIVDKETHVKEELPFGKEVVEDASLFKGDTKVRQDGQNGLREVTYLSSEQNGQIVVKQEQNAKVLQEPINEVTVRGTKVVPSRGDGSFAWPTNGGYVSSQMGYRWGKMHKGIDIARPSNGTIKTVDNGVVVSAGWDGGYGNKIVIDHQNGLRTVYGHLSSIDVSVGQTVPKGSKIGVMGATGDSTGVHLHFEVYKNGSLQNPISYLR
jgi:murein DD-endopeptidase MepM/ murein hydrolase activator NlpD